MDFFKNAFEYPRLDSNWQTKVGILCGIMALSMFFNFLGNLISVLALFTAPILLLAQAVMNGYYLASAKKVFSRNLEPALPEWTDFSNYLVDGLRYLVTFMVYGLPVFVPMLVYGAVLVSLINVTKDADSLSAGLGVGMIILMIFVFLYALVICVAVPAITALLITDSSWGAGFNFSKMVSLITEHTSDYFMTLLQVFVFSLAGSLGLLLCGVGAIFTVPYCSLCSFYCLAKLAQKLIPNDNVYESGSY